MVVGLRGGAAVLAGDAVGICRAIREVIATARTGDDSELGGHGVDHRIRRDKGDTNGGENGDGEDAHNADDGEGQRHKNGKDSES